MLRIRTHPQLRLLFLASNVTGLDIPVAKDAKKSAGLTFWEVTVLFGTFVVLVLIMSTLINSTTSFKITNLSQPVSIFIIYFNVLAKSTNLLMRKRQIMELFTQMDVILNNPNYRKFQNSTVDLVCTRIKKTFIILIAISFICITAMVFVFYVFTQNLERKSGTKLTKDEEITNELVRHGSWSYFEYSVFSINSCLNLVLPIKNIAMDSIMYLCHFFVVQQLNLLNRIYKETLHEKKAVKTIAGYYFVHKDMDNWVEMFNKVRDFQLYVNCTFGLYSVILVSCTIIAMCFVAFTASRYPSMVVITAMTLLAVMFAIQVFCCCISGQNIKESAEKLMDTVTTGPWHDLNVIPSLHLVVAELQRSFSAKGGPFFTLNLELFVSIAGAVFTYFTILVQMK